jgi:hypothetical protein
VANAQAEPSVPALAVVAFTFGTQERRFFTFLYQVANLILSTPGDQADSLQVTSISPETGAPGAVLMVEGSGFRKGATVTVGGQELTKPVTSPDGSSIAGIIPHGKGTVDVMVTNPDDAARRSPKRFTYA